MDTCRPSSDPAHRIVYPKINSKAPPLAGLLFGVPSMNDSLEVEVLYPA
jgi:hypothetical protein